MELMGDQRRGEGHPTTMYNGFDTDTNLSQAGVQYSGREETERMEI